MGTVKKREPLSKYLKYRDIFPKAWKRFLINVEEGKIFSPEKGQEAVLRCHLFSECLLVMREEELPTPYLISAEVEILEGKKADLTLGVLDEENPLVAVEIKCFPTDLDVVADLIDKLGEYVGNERVIFSFFAMIGDSKYVNEHSLDLEKLGLEKDGKFSFYEWRTLKSPYSNISLETLIVGFTAK